MHIINLWHSWKPLVEILILWAVIYQILLFFEGTRAIQILRGIVILLVAFFVFQKLGLHELNWVLKQLFGISVIAVLILFHTEIRQGLARLGQRRIFGVPMPKEELDYVLRQVVKAAEALSKNKTGALIALAKEDSLNAYTESGIPVDAQVTAELIQTVFTPNSLLHDGGLVIQNGRIIAAGCLFPLSQKQDLSRVFGTRHRAAIGLSEETDAVIIIVSEERQDVSFVHSARLYKDLGKEELFAKVKEIIESKET